MRIYKVTNQLNGKVYIGQTRQSLRRRWSGHCIQGRLLTQAIKKYGSAQFTIQSLAFFDSKEDCNRAEIWFISYFSSLAPYGYNLETGGNAKTEVHPATKEKLRLINTGKRASAQTRLKQSRVRSGEKHDAAWVRTQALAQGIKVECIETGQVFNTLTDAAKALGLSIGNVSNIVRGNGTRTKGYSFRKVE